MYFYILGLGYIGDLEDGYTDDVEEEYTADLQGSKSSNINKRTNLLAYWIMVTILDILAWTWYVMFTVTVSRLWVDGFITIISSLSGWYRNQFYMKSCID